MDLRHPVIGIDLIGGDYPPEKLFEHLLLSETEFSGFPHLVFFAPESILLQLKEQFSKTSNKKFEASFVETKHVIEMDDEPLSALRKKKESATPIAMGMLASNELDAFVSIGNTGALIGGAKFHLHTLGGIKRPGLLTFLPTKKTSLAVIDVGANVQCDARHLVEFAMMGIAYQKCMGINVPKVGLLNIGSERIKGRSEMVEAYDQLQKVNLPSSEFSFVGNIEGRDAFQGLVDVLVTDGFSGNIFLKTAEGMTSFILEKCNEEALEAHEKSFVNRIAQDLNYAEYPGALICGVEGIVIKCHGYSNGKAIHSGIEGAINLVNSGFLQKLKSQLKTIF